MTQAGSGNENTDVQIDDIPNLSETTMRPNIMGEKVIVNSSIHNKD